MKKGCFLKSIIIFTVIAAVIIYFTRNQFDSLILNPLKGLISVGVEEELQNKFSYIQSSAEKDSLINFVKDYISSVDNFDVLKDNNFNNFFESVKFVYSDSVITKADLDSFIYLFKESFKNEKSTKN